MQRMKNKQKLKIIPLGGLGEIGKNMMLVEYGRDIIIIDSGLMFPEEDMLGIDLVIPDISYLIEKKDRIRGIIITHAHEDHIGALPYTLPQLEAPIYCTKLAKGLITVKLKERKALAGARINEVATNAKFSLGCFNIELFPVCHSIPDAVGLIIKTPIGTVVHSGDFKLDHTPVDGKAADLGRLSRAGEEGVLLLLSDSTHVELPGYTPSEKVVGETVDNITANAKGRVIVTTFASLISRVQQVIDVAEKHNRRVFIVGRSMNDNVKMSLQLGYLRAPNGIIGRIDELKNMPPHKIMLITTGSQGEPTSALVRIANKDHNQLHIIKGDTVILCSSPIPGNESLVSRTIDSLFKQGANVIYDRLARVHVHGHGSQEELKLIISLVKPKYFIPVHGEYRHLSLHTRLAQEMGIPAENTFTLEDGDVLEITPDSAKTNGRVPSGHVYVDGLSVGDVNGVVLRNRRMLSRDGIVVAIVAINQNTGKIVGRPDIVSRGFVDTNEFQEIMEGSRNLIIKTIDHNGHGVIEWSVINTKIKDALNKYYYENTKRRPMVLPVVVKV
jgi:ribonuclease J